MVATDTSHPTRRELARRLNDGIEITLWWAAHTGAMRLIVQDRNRGQQLALDATAHATPSTTPLRTPPPALCNTPRLGHGNNAMSATSRRNGYRLQLIGRLRLSPADHSPVAVPNGRASSLLHRRQRRL
jgi:hypothetical protein